MGLKLLLSETAAMNETAASGNDSAADVKVLLRLNAADRIYCWWDKDVYGLDKYRIDCVNIIFI